MPLTPLRVSDPCALCLAKPRPAHAHQGRDVRHRRFIPCEWCDDKWKKECALRGCLKLTKAGGSEARPLQQREGR